MNVPSAIYKMLTASSAAELVMEPVANFRPDCAVSRCADGKDLSA